MMHEQLSALETFVFEDAKAEPVCVGENDFGQSINFYQIDGGGLSSGLYAVVWEKLDGSDQTVHRIAALDVPAEFFIVNGLRQLVRVRGVLHWAMRRTFDASRPMLRMRLADDGGITMETCFDSTVGLLDDTPENRVKLRALIEMDQLQNRSK